MVYRMKYGFGEGVSIAKLKKAYQMILNLNGEVVWSNFDHDLTREGEQIGPTSFRSIPSGHQSGAQTKLFPHNLRQNLLR
jgi:hypothetical protein